MNFFAKVWTLVLKDLSLEKRSREMLSSMSIFALLVVLVFSFSFDLRVEEVSGVAPGVVWVAISFAGMLGLARSFVLERDQGCLDGLLLCPIDRSLLYLGKMLSNLLFISLTELVVLPLCLALFNLTFHLLLLPILLLGTIGFSAVGTIVSAMTVHARAREVMLPILLFPLVLPALIASVKLTGGVLDGQPWGEIRNWMELLVGFDVIFMVISYLAFEYVIEE
ncbi:MAG TPA: heme exporter protein CcmB [Anaerolineae bacterium]|nr:heme exporter protein CcmB [Anaerolineae bacterium]